MKRSLFFVKTLLLTLLVGVARAQSVSVTVNVLPPYSSYIQDYASKGNQVQIFVRNTSATPLEVRLLGRVTGDNGVSIATPPNFRPVLPLRLGPMENRLLSRADLEGLFDVAQFVVEGFDRNQLVQGKPLPEGAYQLCVEAYDNRTSRLLSAEFPLGCSAPFMIRYVEPPILITPLCDEAALATTPQALPFTWTPPAGVLPNQVRYTLRVIELPLEGVDPNVYIDAVNLPLSGVEVRDLKVNSFLYSPQFPKLTPGKRYAWRVQASDPTGKLTFLNDGKSPVCAFTYGKITPKMDFQVVANLPSLTWAGLTVTNLKLTNPDPDHLSGTGKIKLIAPLETEVMVSFKDLTVRPTGFSAGQFPETKGYHSYVVMKGTTEVKLAQSSLRLGASTGRSSEGLVKKLKTAPRTGGTAELTYRTMFLQANLPFQLDESKNVFTKNAADGTSGTELAEVRGNLKWESPLLTSYSLKPSGADSKLPMVGTGIPIGTTIEVTALKLPASTGTVPGNSGPNAPVPMVAGISNPANTLTNVPSQTINNVGSPPIQTNPGATPGAAPGKKTPLSSSQAPSQAAQVGVPPGQMQADFDALGGLDDGSLRIPFNTKYDLALTTPLGFKLTLLPTSEFRIKDGTLWVVLDGSLLVPSGREDLPGLTVPIEGRAGLAFSVTLPETFSYRIAGKAGATQEVSEFGGKKTTLTTLGIGSGFQASLRITKMNVKLAELPGADDLPFPEWVTGVTVPKPKVLFTSGFNDEGTKVSIQLVKNIGFGFTTKKSPPLQSNASEIKGNSKYLGFPAQFTTAELALDHTRLESGLLKGLVYIPFVGMIGKLTVPVTEKGLGEANVHNFTAKQRELVVTPAGDRVMMIPKGGSFVTDTKHGTLFLLDARFRFFNSSDPTHFLQTGTKGLGVRGIGIHPNGKLYNPLDGFFGKANGNVAATNYDLVPTDYVGATLNGLDFQVRQTKLETEKTGGNTCTLTLTGTLTLGEKITTADEQSVSISFPRPKDKFQSDELVSFEGFNPDDSGWQPAGSLNLGLGGAFGPSANPDEAEHDAWLADQHQQRLAKLLGWSAPATTMELAADKTIKGSFDQGPLKFDAEFTLFNDNPTYGNGFEATVNAQVREPIQSMVSTTIRAGNVQNVNYWFVEAGGLVGKGGVPVFVDLEAYGFKGRFYHHMNHGGDDPNRSIDASYYVPDASVSFGFYASVPVRTIHDQGALFWGRGSVEFQFKGWSPKSVAFRGTAYVMSSGSEKTDARMDGWTQLTYDFIGKVLSGQYQANANYDVVCGSVPGYFYVGGGNFIVTVGSPGNPATLTGFCGKLPDGLSPQVSFYSAVYYTGTPPGHLSWVPADGIGLFISSRSKLLDLSGSLGPASGGVSVKANGDLYIMIQPSFQIKAGVGAVLDGWLGFSGLPNTTVAEYAQNFQIVLPNPFCVSTLLDFCVPLVGGIYLPLGLKNFVPMVENCFEDPNKPECSGLLNEAIKLLSEAAKLVYEGGKWVAKKAEEIVETVYECLSFWDGC